MPTLFIQQGFNDEARTVAGPPGVQASGLPLQPWQVPVWVSYTEPNYPRDEPPPTAPCWGAVLDTANSHTFLIGEDQARPHEKALHQNLSAQADWLLMNDSGGNQYRVPRVLGDLWLHSNLPDGPKPYRIELGVLGVLWFNSGMVQYLGPPATASASPSRRPPPAWKPVGPRVPILGLRALCQGGLRLIMNCHASGGTAFLYVP